MMPSILHKKKNIKYSAVLAYKVWI